MSPQKQKRKIPVCPTCKNRKRTGFGAVREHYVDGYMKCGKCGKTWRFIK